MISGVRALVVLVALAGCCEGSYRLDDESLGTPNMTLSPVLPKAFGSGLQQAASLDSLKYLSSKTHIQPKETVVGPPCTRGASLTVPAGSNVTFTSPTPPTKALRATYNQCGWQFVTVRGSTFSLTCQSFSLSGLDSFYVYEYRFFSPLIYRFRLQTFPSRLLLRARTVRVLFKYDQIGKQGYFSCTITASGGTTSSTTTTTTSTTTSKPTTISSTSTGVTNSTTTSTTTASPSSKNCKCGIVNRTTRIVGGANTQVNEYPWQVGFMFTTSRFVFCGGSLINDRYIVTAAHCMVGRTASSFRLLLGGHTKDTPSAKEKIVNPIRIITHPQYKVGTANNNDISIIEIAPLDFSDPGLVVRPVCLPDSAVDYAGVLATTTGWGTLSAGGVQPNILREVDIPIVTNAYCQAVYGTATITSNMICAGTAAGGTDSCQGDSGGPLIAPDGTNYELIGVVSFGAGCGDPGVPGVYARVTALQSWIESTVAGSTSCGR